MLRNLATLLAVCLIVPLLALTIGLNEVRGETNVTKLIDNGDPATHVDLTIIGSGFAASEMETYKTKAQQNIDKMLTVNWFATNKTLFNVWRIDAVSPTSGVDLDDATINSMASQVPYDVLIVIHNYDGQESVNKPYVELYKYSHNYVVLAHELGHKIGKLDDEYWASAMAYKCNGLSKLTLNIHDNASNEKWSDLISSSPYEGARFCEKGLWRPTENSIMRDSANSIYFDAVGLKAMDLGAGKILKTVESVAPSLSISGLQDNDTKSGSFTVQAVTSDTSGIERVEFYWAKAGETSKSIKIDKIAPYDLFIDTTKYQDGQYYLDTLSYDKNWNYVRKTILFSISNTAIVPPPPPVTGFNVPVIVSEALTHDSDYYIQTKKRQNMPGMNRTNEPLTVGIPLAEDSGITNISQLGLSGVSIQQFRPLDYWPNGNIKWVLVDTQATVSANSQTTISLVSGTGNSGGSNLAVDNGSYLFVDTGTAQFRIKKSNFNMIDKAVVNGKELVQQNNSGGLSMVGYQDATYTLNGKTHTLVKDRVYDSKSDPDSTAVIEENGPIRTVIKATGSFKDTSGNRLMDYTVRLYFYKGKSYVKSQVIMRNGAREDDKPIKKTFSSMQVSIPLNLGQTKSFEFSTNKGLFSGAIDSSAHIYQGFSMAHLDANNEWDLPGANQAWYYPPMNRLTEVPDANFEQKGLEIKNGQTTLRSLGDQNDWTNDYAEIKDQNNNGLTVAMQYMSSYWPASIEFGNDGNAEIGVFSKFNSKKDVTMGWGTHETRELMLDFHTASVNNQEVMYRIEQPVVGRTTIQHYSDTKIFFGNGIPTAEEFYQWFIDNYGKVDYYRPQWSWHQSNNGTIIWRAYWYSGHAGIDIPLSNLLTFLKNGTGGRYMGALQKTIFNTDSAVVRTDGFDYSQSFIGTIDETECYNRGGGQNVFDYGHAFWEAMPYYYYITGNEEIKDAINDHLETFIKRGSLNLNISINVGYGLRGYSRYYATIGRGYEFNKDARLKTILEDMTNKLLDSRENPPNLLPQGRNLNRGYLWADASYFAAYEQAIHSFCFLSIFSQDTWQVLKALQIDKSYIRIEELEDLLLGFAQFTYNEFYFENSSKTDFGNPYDYWLNKSNEWIEGVIEGMPGGGNYMRKDDISRLMLIAYSNTGDPKYLERGKKLLAFGGGSGPSTPYPAHDLIYADLHGLPEFWSYVNNISAVNNGNNNYTLTWTVPQGATAYKIKFSDKPIVDWLGFNQVARTYQYDPANYTAFFAATNVDDEPAPLQSGSVQSYTIDIAQAINSYNAVRNLSPGNPSYVVYDPSKTYYFSVKYLSSIQSPSSCGDGTCNGAETCSSCSQDCGTCSNKGDLTADNQVNIQDIQACVNHILGAQDWGAAADVNSDGAVNVLDVQAIVNIILGS